MPQPLEIGKDAGLGHLALEAAQSGFDPFVFADGDLGHEVLLKRGKWTNLASLWAGPVQILGGAAGRGACLAGAALVEVGADPF